MNNYHTLLALKPILKETLKNASVIHAFSMFKNQLELIFDTQHSKVQLVISTLPNKACMFLDKEIRIKNKNVVVLFSQLYHKKLVSINVIENDRIVTFSFEDNYLLILQLFGNQPNVYLCQSDDLLILHAFKKSETYVGQPFEFPSPKASNQPNSTDNLKQVLLKKIPTIDRQHLKRLAMYEPEEASFEAFANRILKQLEIPKRFYLFGDGSISSIDPSFFPDLEVIKSFKEANEAVRFAHRYQISRERFSERKSQNLQIIEGLLKADRVKLQQLLDHALVEDRAEQYEAFAHSLMSYGALKSDWGQCEKVELPDVYNSDEWLQIVIDPQLSAVQNAEKYYARAKHARQSYQQNQRSAELTKIRISQLNKALNDLHDCSDLSDLREWDKANKKWIELSKKRRNEKQENLPFRVIETNELTIWLGKNAKSNDALLRESHKEDIWFHAKDVAGSHALIRMANDKNMPDKSTIEAVAELAAYHSKLKGSSLVPVSYTKRKFVRKPKNAAPGLALVDKEEVILVKPSNAILEI